jgi:hypothetical protein
VVKRRASRRDHSRRKANWIARTAAFTTTHNDTKFIAGQATINEVSHLGGLTRNLNGTPACGGNLYCVADARIVTIYPDHNGWAVSWTREGIPDPAWAWFRTMAEAVSFATMKVLELEL